MNRMTMQTNYDIPIGAGKSTVLNCTHPRMVFVPEALYADVFERLCEAIDGENYYSGSLDFRAGGLDCRLVVEAVVYRETVSAPDGDWERIRDLVPVWWEFHTEKEGEELPNDFQFSEMRKNI